MVVRYIVIMANGHPSGTTKCQAPCWLVDDATQLC